MNVRVVSMCQGDGKIYVQVAIERISPDAVLGLEAHLKDGTVIPSHLLSVDPLEEQGGANFTVIVPHFDEREIMLEFSEYVSADSPLGHAHLTIETNMLSWRTRINSVVKNELITQMLDIEREYYSDRMHTSFTCAVDDEDEIVVKMLVDLPLTEGADVEVRFMDAHGKERDLPVYPLFEEVKPARRFGDESRLNVGFSVRVPRGDKDFCVSASDALDVVSGGFAMFCDETYEPLRAQFFDKTHNAGQDPAYNDWYLHNSATLADLAEQRRTAFVERPLISLIMPFTQTDKLYLAQTLRALKAQTYGNFEVVVVDRYYEDLEFEAMLLEAGGFDGIVRVKVDEKLDFDKAFEAGLDQARGNYCALLYPYLTLAPEALYEMVRRVNEGIAYEDAQPASIIYAHHDYIDASGALSGAAIKPVYSPDLLLSHNYIGPFVLFDRSLLAYVREETGFVAEALVYDLLFKAYEVAGSMERIDQVLYHVQVPSSSNPEEEKARIEAREEDFRGGRRVVANHLKRIGIEATVLSDIKAQAYRINYALPEELPRVLAVIVNHDQPYLLEACLDALYDKAGYNDLHVCVVDNGSTHHESFMCFERIQREYENLFVIKNDERLSFSACVNAAAEAAECDYLLLLDTNTEVVTEGFVERMVSICQREDVGVVGAKLIFADDTIAQAGITVGSVEGSQAIGTDLPRNAQGYLKRLTCANDVSAVSKACQLIKRSVFDGVGGYDGRFRMAFNDTDFCLKVIKAGYLVVYDPEVELYHFENIIQDEHLNDQRRMRLEQERAYLHFRWPRAFVEGDPFMSRLLAPGNGYYQLYY